MCRLRVRQTNFRHGNSGTQTNSRCTGNIYAPYWDVAAMAEHFREWIERTSIQRQVEISFARSTYRFPEYGNRAMYYFPPTAKSEGTWKRSRNEPYYVIITPLAHLCHHPYLKSIGVWSGRGNPSPISLSFTKCDWGWKLEVSNTGFGGRISTGIHCH